jgi:hypothetical protein
MSASVYNRFPRRRRERYSLHARRVQRRCLTATSIRCGSKKS